MARYLVAASVSGLEAAICLNKADLEASDDVRNELSLWKSLGFTVLETSTKSGLGLTALTDFLSSESAVGSPWSLVGLSGVGKTSIVSMLLPNQDVGPIGEISEHWDQGKHTTTHSTIFELPEGGELCDSPGIRTFTPQALNRRPSETISLVLRRFIVDFEIVYTAKVKQAVSQKRGSF